MFRYLVGLCQSPAVLPVVAPAVLRNPWDPPPAQTHRRGANQRHQPYSRPSTAAFASGIERMQQEYMQDAGRARVPSTVSCGQDAGRHLAGSPFTMPYTPSDSDLVDMGPGSGWVRVGPGPEDDGVQEKTEDTGV